MLLRRNEWWWWWWWWCHSRQWFNIHFYSVTFGTDAGQFPRTTECCSYKVEVLACSQQFLSTSSVAAVNALLTTSLLEAGRTVRHLKPRNTPTKCIVSRRRQATRTTVCAPDSIYSFVVGCLKLTERNLIGVRRKERSPDPRFAVNLSQGVFHSRVSTENSPLL